MALNQSIWAASSKRRRWILRRYGRGPRKKPPDPPDPPNRKLLPVEPLKHRPTVRRFTRRDIRLIRCRTATFNPLCRSRIIAPFLARSRRPLNRISQHYSRRGQYHPGHYHGSRPLKHFRNLLSQSALGTFSANIFSTFSHTYKTLSHQHNSLKYFWKQSTSIWVKLSLRCITIMLLLLANVSLSKLDTPISGTHPINTNSYTPMFLGTYLPNDPHVYKTNRSNSPSPYQASSTSHSTTTTPSPQNHFHSSWNAFR